MKRVLLLTLLISFIGYSQILKRSNFSNKIDKLYMYELKNHNSDDRTKFQLLNIPDFQNQDLQEYNPSTNNYNSSEVVNLSFDLIKHNRIYFDMNDITSKTIREWDDNGNETLYTRFNWDTESQSFVPDRKEEYTYDENGNETLYIRFNWDTESQSFVPSWKYEKTYDDNGNETLYIRFNWDSESQSFVPDRKEEYTYDENGNETLNIRFYWDTESQSFVPDRKEEYTYDENENETVLISYDWDSESQSFVPWYKWEKIYDENGNETLYISYNWDSESQSFIPDSKREYTYDEDGNETLYISYNWDSESQSFVPSSKRENTYDENGNETLYIRFNWDSESQSFVPFSKRESTFDGDFLTLKSYTTYEEEKTEYYYDKEYFYPEMWYKLKKFKYYNGIGFRPSFEQICSVFSETNELVVELGKLFRYDNNFNTWDELEGEEFQSYWYWKKDSSLSKNSVESNLFSIYPNPTSNTLQTNSSEYLNTPIFELYDVKGSKILSNPFKLTEPIDVSDLQPSLYIYNVKDGSEVKQSGKVLIE